MKYLLIILFIFIMLSWLSWKLRHKKPANKYRKTTLKQRKMQSKVPFPHTKTLRSVRQFHHDFNRPFTLGKTGDVILAPVSDGRIHGAWVNLSADLMRERQAAITNKWIKRDDKERQSAHVPGFKDAKPHSVQTKSGTYALWHRTHLLPFRFVLTDGKRIPTIMFTGTAHLNHGDRPQLGYFISAGEADRRGRYLYQAYRQNHWQLSMKSFRQINVNYKYMPKDTHYSLDDIERLASHIIRTYKDKQTPFRYAVMCEYNNENQGFIPNSVRVNLFNLRTKEKLLDIKLPNTF